MPKKKERKKEEKTEEETLAENIARISEGMKSLFSSGLNEKAVVILLKHKTGLSQSVICKVLDGLGELEGCYCKKRDLSGAAINVD